MKKNNNYQGTIDMIEKIRKSMQEVPVLKPVESKPVEAKPIEQPKNTLQTMQSAVAKQGSLLPDMSLKSIALGNVSSPVENTPLQGKNEPKKEYKTLDYYTRKDLEEERSNIRAKGQGMTSLESKRMRDINKQLAEDEKARTKKQDNYLVHRDQYNELMKDSQMQKDIDALAMAYARSEGTRGRGVRAIQAMGYKNSKEFAESLAEKYNLSKEQIDDIVKTYTSDRTNAQTKRLAEKSVEYGDKHPVLGTVGSALLGATGSAVEGAYNALAGLTNDDRNVSRMFNTLKGGLREGVTNDMGKVGKTVYNLGMGLGDLAVGAASGNAPLLLAGNTTNDAFLTSMDNGADLRNASAYSIGSGIADYFLNKKGLDKAKELAVESIKSAGIKGALAKNAIAGAGEAGENIIQDIAQSLLDQLINGENSELQTSFADKVARGMTEDQALSEVAKEYGKQIAMSAGTGYLMGAAMQGGQTAMNHFGTDIAAGLLKKKADAQSEDVWNKVEEYKKANPNEFTEESVNTETPINTDIDAQKVGEITNEDVSNQKPNEVEAPIENEAPKQPRLPMNLQMFAKLRSEKLALEKQARAEGISAEEKVSITEQIKAIDDQLSDLREKITDDVVNSGIMSPEDIANDKNFEEVSKRISQFATNTAKRAGLVDDEMLANDPLIAEAARVERHSNEKTLAAAMNTVKTEGQEWMNKVIDGEYTLGSPTKMKNGKVDYETADQDFDTCMIYLRQLKEAMLNAKDDNTRQALRAKYAALFAKTRQFSSNAGRVLQAHKKWAGTAEGAEMAFAADQSQRTKRWKDKNGKTVDLNNRLASAIKKMLNPKGGNTEKTPLSYDEIRQQVVNTLEAKLPDMKVDDNAIDYLTALVEDGEVPTWQIADELQHYRDHGEFYTIDESTKLTKDKSAKLQQALNTAFKADEEGTPKAEEGYLKTLERVKNTLEDESSSVKGIFDDFDYEVITEFLLDKVPVWKIRDEIEHRLQHGEWYPIEDATPAKLQKNNRLINLLDEATNGKPEKVEKTPLTDEERIERIRNVFEDYETYHVDEGFNDNDYRFIDYMFQEKIPKEIIVDELRHKYATGEWYTIDESMLAKKPTNQRIKNALKPDTDSSQKVEKPQPTFEQLREQIKNTFDKTFESEPNKLEDWTDDDYGYLASMYQQGATRAELADAINTRMANGSFGLSAEAQAKVSDLGKLMDSLNPESEDYANAQLEMYRIIANESNAKADALEKFDAWRYLAMLGNPRTMIRNLVGNKLSSALTGISNTVAALGESATNRWRRAHGLEEIERTKAVYNPFSKANKDLIRLNKQDFNKSRYVSGAGTKYKDTADALKDARSTFDSGWAQLYEKLTKAGISDTTAVRNKYATSLTGYMKANGLTEADMEASYKYDAMRNQARKGTLSSAERSEMERLKPIYDKMEKGRDYALKEADYATFHEDSEFANALTKMANENDALNVIINGIVPFKKTPINILKMGLDFSPLGLTKSGYLMIKRAHENRVDYPDTYTNFRGKEVQRTTANDIIDSWSKSLTGTIMAALGYLLYSKGILTSSDKDERYQDQLEGLQNFAIKLNIGGKDRTYTIDWAAPACMPLLMGAEVKKIMEEHAVPSELMNPTEMIRMFNSVLNPLVETSMLEGVQNTMNEMARQVNNYDGDLEDVLGGALGALASQAATGYVTQAVPTLLGQVARTVDGTRRSTDTISTNPMISALEKQGRKTMNKIPLLSMLNNPYVDARGEEQSNNPLAYEKGDVVGNIGKGAVNLAYQMVSPGYFDTVDTRPSDIIARNAFNGKDEEGNAIRDNRVFADWKSQVKLNGRKLTPDEMYDYRTASGKANTEVREALAQADWFNALPPSTQTEILNRLNNMVEHVGKKAVDDGYVSGNEYYEAYTSGGKDGLLNFIQTDIHKSEVKDAIGSTKEWAQEIYDSGNQADIDLAKKANEIIGEYGKDTLSKTQWEAIKEGGEAGLRKMLKEEEAREKQKEEHASEYDVLKQYGYTTESMQKKYDSAKKTIPTITADEFAKTFKAIDTGSTKNPNKPNQTISQDEAIAYMNKNKMSQSKGMEIWNAYGNWQTVPVLDENGTWKKAK